ncbi:MAG: sirohydrochlorin chelatase [Magnetococcales bacterium]|nr:sirohydrochlorin chelatase [Magnetococcales bacterium]
MRETILLVGHGSREVEGNQEVEDFADYWRSRHPETRMEVCFIEFAQVLLPEGLARAAKGSDRVIVLPLILNAAEHVKREIPDHLAEARKAFPEVTFLLGRHLGVDESIEKLLRMRLHSAMAAMDMPDPDNTAVILLGRGASDKTANGEVAKMARWLYEDTRHSLVDYAFTGITQPRLEGVVQRQVRLGAMQLIVLPYYLFTGRLIKRIGRQVDRLRSQYPGITFGLAGYLGINDRVVEVLDRRLAEVREGSRSMLECDGCHYRFATVNPEKPHCG